MKVEQVLTREQRQAIIGGIPALGMRTPVVIVDQRKGAATELEVFERDDILAVLDKPEDEPLVQMVGPRVQYPFIRVVVCRPEGTYSLRVARMNQRQGVA